MRSILGAGFHSRGAYRPLMRAIACAILAASVLIPSAAATGTDTPAEAKRVVRA